MSPTRKATMLAMLSGPRTRDELVAILGSQMIAGHCLVALIKSGFVEMVSPEPATYTLTDSGLAMASQWQTEPPR